MPQKTRLNWVRSWFLGIPSPLPNHPDPLTQTERKKNLQYYKRTVKVTSEERREMQKLNRKLERRASEGEENFYFFIYKY